MKKGIVLLLVTLLIVTIVNVVLSESWICPSCGNEADNNFCSFCGTQNTSDNWICPRCKNTATGNFCNNCGNSRPSIATKVDGDDAVTPAPTSDHEDVPVMQNDPTIQETQQVTVKNYVGLTINRCGYTSWGGERRDYYGDTNVKLVLLSLDGNYIDPKDDSLLNTYTVLAQYPAANTQFSILTYADGSMTNLGYSEITLVVGKDGEADSIPDRKSVRPSPSREIQYVKDYRGISLADVGYTSWGGDRYDKYGPAGLIQIFISDTDGNEIDPNDYSTFSHYVVVSQNVQPDTEVRFVYSVDSDGDESVTSQTLAAIRITVMIPKEEQAKVDALAAEEEKQRESGVLTDLYPDTYEVGVDLREGNYELTPIDGKTASSIYIYKDKDALDNGDGDWKYLYGADDKEQIYLHEGMYIKVNSGIAKAKWSVFDINSNEFELFAGVYHVGTQIRAGNYSLHSYNDTDSCSLYVYQDEAAYLSDDGKWYYLYGASDVEYVRLKEGMILCIKSGATKVKVN